MRGIAKLSIRLLAVTLAVFAATSAHAAVTPGVLLEPAYGTVSLGQVAPALTSEPAPVTDPAAARLPDAPVQMPGFEWADGPNGKGYGPEEKPRPLHPVLGKIADVPAPIEALADVADDETGNPLVDFSYLSAGPKSFVLVRSGKPGGDAVAWQHVTDTALSYVRPHRNLEFVMTLHGAKGSASDLSSSMVSAESQLIDNLKVEADTRSMVEVSSAYGYMEPMAKTGSAKAGRMVAFGLDLGLLPAMLADVGISATITIGESENPGPFLSVATNLEVPSERERDRTTDSLWQTRRDLFLANGVTPSPHFSSGFSEEDGGGGGGGGGGDSKIPIIPNPPVPEPSTLLLLAAGTALVAARRRASRQAD